MPIARSAQQSASQAQPFAPYAVARGNQLAESLPASGSNLRRQVCQRVQRARMPCAPRMRIRTVRTGARRRRSSRRIGLQRSSDKKSCLAFRTTGVSGTAGKEPKVLIRRRSKQYVRRFWLARLTGGTVRPQEAADEKSLSVLGGTDNSDSTCRQSRTLRALGLRSLAPSSTVLSRTALVRRTD